MRFILLRVRVDTIVHGYDEAHQQITEVINDGVWSDKLLALDRLLSATEQHLLVAGSHGRVMYWAYEGGLAWLTRQLVAAGETLDPQEAT